jgi:6-pyruvoyltetrahydropterin/6-carboxytetrahydropterin synthase
MTVAILTRRETFSSAHRLHSPHLSDEENRALFGKCNSANGHGHNYVLEVSVRGAIDQNGLVMNLTKLKEIIHERVIAKVDHKHLDLDVPEFKNNCSTAENIAVVIWGWLKPVLGDLLYEVKLHETENNVAVYRGD